MGVAVTSIAKKVLTGHCAGSSWWCRGAAEKSRRCGHIASVTGGSLHREQPDFEAEGAWIGMCVMFVVSCAAVSVRIVHHDVCVGSPTNAQGPRSLSWRSIRFRFLSQVLLLRVQPFRVPLCPRPLRILLRMWLQQWSSRPLSGMLS